MTVPRSGAARLLRSIATIGVAAIATAGLALPATAGTPTKPPTTAQHGRGMPNLKPVTPPVVPEPNAGPKPTTMPPPAVVHEPDALAQAKASGKPVPVTADTTGTTDVVANPNGSFTMRSTLLPVRAKKNGVWVPIDTTLHANPDGTYSPAATTADVRFSGGGTAPMVTMADGTNTLALTWPTALPTPTVSGASATYTSVLPGVDLILTADAADYRQVLVVHDEAAAANPALAAIHLAATAHGLTLHTDTAGLLAATDATGKTVFHGSTPIMWDSTVNSRMGGTPSAADPGSGRVSQLAVHTTATAVAHGQATVGGFTATSAADVAVVPDPSALTGPGVRYPLFIDPQMNQGEQAWVEVTANGWHYFDQNMLAQVGDCGSWPGCGGLTVARSYFQMGTSGFTTSAATVTVWSANFFASEQHNAAGCGVAEPVNVDWVGTIDGNTRWPGPADNGLMGTSPSSGSEGCPANIPPVDVSVGARAAANAHAGALTLLLRSPDEGDQNQWKQFKVSATQPYSPELDITYSYPPNPATGLSVGNAVTCNGTAYVPDGQTTMYASASDNNSPPLNPGLNFQLSNNNFASNIATSPAIRIGSGTTGAWTSPVTLGAGNYQFRVAVDNQPGSSQDLWAGVWTNYNFTRLSAPTVAPVVATDDYPPNYWGESTDNPGAVAFYAMSATNIAGYTWTLLGPGSEPVPATGQCNYNQTFSSSNGISGGYVANTSGNANSFGLPTGMSVGNHTIYVRTFDFAHNLSPESQPYTFYVAAPTGVSGPGWVEAETAPHSEPAGENIPIAIQPNCCNINWSGGQQLTFAGSAPGQSFSMNFTANQPANYELATNLTRSYNYGILTMSLDGTPLTLNGLPQFDGYNAVPIAQYESLGTAYLTAGTHTMTVTMVDTNAASVGNRYQAGIDGFVARATNQLDVESPLAVQATNKSGNITPVVEPDNNGMGWKAGAQLNYPATAPNQAVNLAFTTASEADYGLGLHLTQKSNYGQLKFTLDDTTVLANTQAAPFDGYSGFENWVYFPLGGTHLTAGQHHITITVVGKNANSTGFQAGTDFLTVAAVNNITASSFGAAMNNHGIVDDNIGGGSLDMVGNALSAQAMAAVGVAPGSTYHTSGAGFAIPRANATGNDNVIADGQTIPLPQVNATALGLLVTATCGWTPEAPTTITYGDNTHSNPFMPTVADWVNGGNNSATVVTPHADNAKGVPPGNTQARLYAVFLPTNPGKPLKSITLPYTGATQLPNTCTPGASTPAALHVFSIAPRPAANNTAPNGETWLGAWSAPVDAATVPPGGTTLSGDTLRTVVHPTANGDSTRIRLSNLDTSAPVTIDAASIAAQSGTGAATVAAPTALTFGGTTGVTLPVGGEVDSDPVAFPSTTGGSGDLLVSLHLPAPGVTQLPVHTTRTNATYLSAQNDTTNQTGTPFTTAVPGDYLLTGVEVSSTDHTAGTIAVLGDQVSNTGAAGGTCDGNSGYACTWVDDLAAIGAGQLPGTVVNVSRAGTPAQDQWRLTDATGSTAADTGGTHPATATGGVTWSTAWAGDVAGSAGFDGTTGYLATSGPALNTTTNFSISAWVNPRQLGSAWQTFVVQQAGTGSGFYLEYDGTTDRWSFSRVATDTMNPVIDRAESTSPAVANTWTHLVGTYAPGASQMTLFVNGVSVATAIDTTPIAANGPLVIGRGYYNGGPSNYTNGAISDVRVYQRTLDSVEVNNIWDSAPPQQVAPGAGAPSAFSLGTTFGSNVTAMPTDPSVVLNETLGNEPNLRTVIVAIGANDVLNDEPTTLIEQNLTAIMSTSRALGMKNLFRSDGSLVHVVLATIPPLGLAAGDPREPIREQLNADILTNFRNFGADDVVDLDQAVSGNPTGQLPANLVTNGLPNAEYYSDLANAMQAAIAHFPPPF
jgi:hypothetical protein